MNYMIETNRVEWKREYTDDIKKELVAFANTSGGELVIGIGDDGTIYGVEKPDQVSAQVTNMIRDSISPDLTLNTYVQIKYSEGTPLIHITINRGTKRPYYISKKGMTSSGVYVRQGNTSVPASSDAIREMIRETDGFSYESQLSFEQSLSFEYFDKVIDEKGIPFGKTQKRTLRITNSEGLYTNLGMLLSDQCFHSIQFACFQGTEIGTFVERQKLTGSILKQLDDAFAIMSRYNRTHSVISGLHRIDTKEYPEGALREALVNSIVHRDYDRDVSTNIRVFDDRIEISSFGGLPSNTTIETFLLGLSIPRNRNLADIFYRLELIEAFGAGIPKMAGLYQAHGKEIFFKTSPSGFMVSLPSLFYKESKTLNGIQSEGEQLVVSSLSEKRSDELISYMRQHGSLSRTEIEKLLGIGRTSTTRLISTLIQKGIITSIGSGRDIRYNIT